jgi:hypothetical protein
MHNPEATISVVFPRKRESIETTPRKSFKMPIRPRIVKVRYYIASGLV